MRPVRTGCIFYFQEITVMAFSRKILTSVLLLPLIAACGGPHPHSSVSKEQIAKNRAVSQAVWATRAPVQYQGWNTEVAISSDRTFAFVGTKSLGKTFTVPQLVGAAAKASGCVAKDTSVLAFLSGPKDTPIGSSGLKKSDFFRVSLTC
jgi:hypothetical protein